MDTQTATPVEPKVRIFELVDQQNSTYRLEGTEGDSAVFLKAPGTRVILSNSIYVNPKGEHIRIRYIKGCQFLEVEKQEEKKIRRSITDADVLEFKNGKMVVVDEGEGKTIIDYLTRTSLNRDALNRKSDVEPMFYEVKKEAEVQKAIDEFFSAAKVYEALRKLAIEEGGRTRYNEENIDYLCSLFNIRGLDKTAYGEKFQALAQFGKVNPISFLQTIADEQAKMKALVLTAIQMGVAGFEGNDFVFTTGKKVIAAVKTKKIEERIQEVTNALMESEAFNDYQQLILLVKQTNEQVLLNKQLEQGK